VNSVVSFTEKLKYSWLGKLSINVATSTLLSFCRTTWLSNSSIYDLGHVDTLVGAIMRESLLSKKSSDVRKVPITIMREGKSISKRVFL